MGDDSIGLYFRLKPGEKADLEVVATAALEWLESARAAAEEIEPGSRINIGLVDADEASLQLNTVLEWVESQLERVDRGGGRYPRLKKLAVALAIFVPTTGVSTYKLYFGPQHEVALKEDDRKLIEENSQLLHELIERTHKNPDVGIRRQKFFKALEQDPSIVGAGVSEGPKYAPLILIPSDQFAEKSGLWVPAEAEPDERTIYPIVNVTLISPTLLPKPRSWRFQPADGLPEFSAKMRDAHFLAALESDHVKERLRTGIRMTIRLQVKEARVGDVWLVKPRGRSVVEVIEPKV
ncbi:hypothetical protein [Bradyrhizobium sp. LA2.1]|uniref:hypothetical protein n=1 Tax=Bradyrhizobium sp. LA2.1 TaxID=3156376 RepID=UPI00339503D1